MFPFDGVIMHFIHQGIYYMNRHFLCEKYNIIDFLKFVSLAAKMNANTGHGIHPDIIDINFLFLIQPYVNYD